MSAHPDQFRLLLPEALTGRLDPAEEQRVMAHVAACESCQAIVDDLEVSLVSLAVLRVDREQSVASEPGAAPAPGPVSVEAVPTTVSPDASAGDPADELAEARRRRSRNPLTWVVGAAAALALLFGGIGIGHAVLPARDAHEYGRALALTPPAGAPDQAARGTVAVAADNAALVVRLDASDLPNAGWYECVWVANGQTRSAGSFRAVGGQAKDVELRVAQPQDANGWDLQLVAHRGDQSEVVLQGSVPAS